MREPPAADPRIAPVGGSGRIEGLQTWLYFHNTSVKGYAGENALCARRNRPRDRRAAKERDELPPFHSITSSARASSVGGTSMPNILAVCRLMTSSNLVARTTGRSAG